MQSIKAILHTDGGSRGNPGPAAGGAVLIGDDGREIGRISDFCGTIATNNVAEYRGLIAGLGLAYKHGVTDLDVFIDSEVVARQLSGEYGIASPTLAILKREVDDFMTKFGRCVVHQVSREQIADADAVVNVCLDRYTREEERAKRFERELKRALKVLGTLKRHVGDTTGEAVLLDLEERLERLKETHGIGCDFEGPRTDATGGEEA